MLYDMRGTVKAKGPAQTKGAYTFYPLVVTTKEGQYENHIELQASGDRVAQCELLAIGQEISVRFAVQGREWRSPQGEVKHFNTLKLVSLTVESGAPVHPVAATAKPADDCPF